MDREQAAARGYKLGNLRTIGDLRGAAFQLSQLLRGTDHDEASSILHDAIAVALPEDSDAPLLPSEREDETPAMVAILNELAFGETTGSRMNEIMAEARQILARIDGAS